MGTLPTIFEQFPIPTKQTVNPIDGSNVAYEPKQEKATSKEYSFNFYEWCSIRGSFVRAFRTSSGTIYTVPRGYIFLITSATLSSLCMNPAGYTGALTSIDIDGIPLLSLYLAAKNADVSSDNITSSFTLPILVLENKNITVSGTSASMSHCFIINGYLVPKPDGF